VVGRTDVHTDIEASFIKSTRRSQDIKNIFATLFAITSTHLQIRAFIYAVRVGVCMCVCTVCEGVCMCVCTVCEGVCMCVCTVSALYGQYTLSPGHSFYLGQKVKCQGCRKLALF